MSTVRNRSHSSHAATPVARAHCVRVRRIMGRKHQLQRREHGYSSVLARDHHQDRDKYFQAATYMKSSGSNSNDTYTSAAFSRRKEPRSSSNFRWHNGNITDRSGEQHHHSSIELVSPFSLGATSRHHFGDEALSSSCISSIMSPVTQAVQTADMDYSLHSIYTPICDGLNTLEGSFSQQPQFMSRIGARAHSSGSAGSGGGGGSDGSGATAPADMNPGGGDATDGDQPSDYTFRRRNAIVEGSEDAPKAEDFPSSSPK
ncbi:hypothetical protein EDD11_006951 [Mortierella claussenii]|nr:hypothetical protein EDD11_006951 [Mortierella claussenii]